MNIRISHRADWPGVLAINAECVPHVSPLNDTELNRLAGQAAYFRVAEHDAAVLGYCLAFAPTDAYDGEDFIWFRNRVPEALYVDQVAVSPMARRMRIASTLYRDVAQFATEHGFSSLACEVNLRPANQISIEFHDHFGFERIGTLETADGRLVSLLLLDLGRVPMP